MLIIGRMEDQPAESKWRILLVASEAAPYAKAGGLGDVVSGLAKALHERGHDVRIVMPLYRSIDRARHGIEYVGNLCTHFGRGEELWCGVHEGLLDSRVPVVFLDYGRFFDRSGIYDDGAREYGDNAYRFTFLSKAAMQWCKDRAWIPDVIHVHDWQTAVLPVLLRTWDRVLSPMSQSATVLTIHNIGYQGVYTPEVMDFMGLGPEHFNPDTFEDHGRLNLLKAGIRYADAITTVSPTHAHELLDTIGGCGLAPYLGRRQADLHGILNGADYELWNPAADPMIAKPFDGGHLEGKALCRKNLRDHFGLEDNGTPILGIVSRLVEQKGMGIMRGMLEAAVRHCAIQVVVLGTGDPAAHAFFDDLARRYPGRVGVHIGFSNELSHRIYAGSDFFFMPSLYEPCGLSQMYAMKYGSLPVVRATGGLADTVRDGQTGLLFTQPDAGDAYHAIERMVRLWYDRPEEYRRMQETAMAVRFTWEQSVREYESVYAGVISRYR
ncbi:MAG: glycogen synthase [Candidatus Methylacidiphilales bacterium]|nr:glycogen synthase [Candidatus Methylacidiphilales bacterium]